MFCGWKVSLTVHGPEKHGLVVLVVVWVWLVKRG